MMKKRSVRILSMVLCIAILCMSPAYATDTRASERISLSGVKLSKTDDGVLYIYYMVQATGRMDVIGASSVEVQRYSLLGWTTEYTYTPDVTPELQSKSEPRHGVTLFYTPKYTGKSYRVIVMIYVEDASGVSTKKLTSESVAIE